MRSRPVTEVSAGLGTGRASVGAVLDFAWTAAEFTASEAMAGTSLTLTLTPASSERARVLRTSLAEATASDAAWQPAARSLLERAPIPRLAGVGVTLERLVPVDRVQGALF